VTLVQLLDVIVATYTIWMTQFVPCFFILIDVLHFNFCFRSIIRFEIFKSNQGTIWRCIVRNTIA
jgi:hypothetical protein